MIVRVYDVGVVDGVSFGVAEGTEIGETDRIIRFVLEIGEARGLQLALENGARPVYDVKDPLRVLAIDGVYPHVIGNEVPLPTS